MSQFRDAYGEFRRENTEVATVSVDTPHAHRVWAQQLDVPFPMLSDFNRQIMAAYRIPPRSLDLLENIHTRTAFVIDSGKVLRYAWYGFDRHGMPPIEEILDAVRRLPEDA